MGIRIGFLIWVLVFTLHFNNIDAQTSGDRAMYWIEMIDGSTLIGFIESEDDSYISISTEKMGIVKLVKTDILSKKLLQVGRKDVKKDWPENLHSTRYFFAPNGYNLRKGESYYQNIAIITHQFSYGFSDNFSLGAGIMPLFIIAGAPSPVWITPKFSVPVVENKLNVGVGALLGSVISADFRVPGFGLLYATSTLGSRDKNISFGAGWAYVDGNIARYPTFNLSGILRLGPKGYIMTENYFIGTSDDFLAMISLGGRRLFSEIALDFGLFLPVTNLFEDYFGIPWLGLAIPISKVK